MGKTHIVKARKHYGSESLDLTIPADVRRELGINVGDVFLVYHEIDGDDLIIKYKRILKINDRINVQ